MKTEGEEGFIYAEDERISEEVEIPEPPTYSLCLICPYKSYLKTPLDNSTTVVKRKAAIENCNKWAKRRKMEVRFKVRVKICAQ